MNLLYNRYLDQVLGGWIYPYLMAISTIVTVPILVMYFFAQRTFIEQISLTGLKG